MLEILDKLGVNYTIFAQIIIWIIAYVITKRILLDKLVSRIKLRDGVTIGSEDETNQILKKAHEKEQEYGAQAKKLNEQIKDIFSKKLEETEQEVLKKISIAKKEAHKSLELVRTDIEKQKKITKAKLLVQVPEFSSLIKEKIF